MDFLKDLNKEQRIAAEHIDGPFLCIAGPGSGKTFTLVRRVFNLVQHNIKPTSILVVTFTRAAANEMRERYLTLPNSVDGPAFCTIHSFTYRILMVEEGYTSDQIMDEQAQIRFIRDLMMNEDINRTNNDIRRIAKNMISDFSSYHCAEDKASWAPRSFPKKSQFLPYYEKYTAYKEKHHMIDYDDMLFKCRDLFLTNKVVLNKYREMFHYIMVDEFQDTSRVQADILYMLAAPRNNIFITGDDDQSIYEFRSARPDIMLSFPKKYPDCGIARLTTNYRSGRIIIKAAENLIGHNKERFDKDIRGYKDEDGDVFVQKSATRADEMSVISKYIKNEHSKNDVAYKNIAVLCRTNAEVSKVVRELSDQDIPFVANEMIEDIHDTWLFKTLLSYLKVIYQKDTMEDRAFIINRPSRYVKKALINETKADLDELIKVSSKNSKGLLRMLREDLNMMKQSVAKNHYKSMYQVLKDIILLFDIEDYISDYCNYAILDEDRYLDMLQTILDEAEKYHSFNTYITSIEKSDKKLKEKRKKSVEDGVAVSTIHRAKGLEWDEVIIPSCIHGNLPSIPQDDPEPDGPHEEERRLFYVALTRAKKKCMMVTVQGFKESEYVTEATSASKSKPKENNEQFNYQCAEITRR